MWLWQNQAVWKNRKIPISGEAQPSAAAARVKHSLFESTFNNYRIEFEESILLGRGRRRSFKFLQNKREDGQEAVQ